MRFLNTGRPSLLAILALCSVICGTISIAASDAASNMREPLFATTDAARDTADALRAPLLAPESYDDALDYYDRAETTLSRGGNIETIRRFLDKAESLFNQSAQAAEVAAVAFESVLEVRMDAKSSDAAHFSPALWREAEVAFTNAAQRLERGKIRYAQKSAEKAEMAYREAELESIKSNYLNETEELIRQAKKLKASRYAPVSLTRAQDLLMNAEAELISNRYDTDRPRSLALEAKHNAKHAIYIAKLARAVKKRKTSVEEVLLEWESSIRQLGHAIDKPLYFDDGEYAAIWTVMEAIKDLHAENEHLNLALNDGSAQLAALNAEVQAMQMQLGGEYDTIEELHDLLAKQKRMRDRFAKVESLFTNDQANVLRKGDNVIIRMIGLNFDSGAAELKSNHMLLLTTLEQAIGGFPESHVVVEGHTDAFGSDALNITLSQERADAVVDHLLANMPISPANLTAFGYGESRPVANNETEEGRTRNRRIDIVIQPNW